MSEGKFSQPCSVMFIWFVMEKAKDERDRGDENVDLTENANRKDKKNRKIEQIAEEEM